MPVVELAIQNGYPVRLGRAGTASPWQGGMLGRSGTITKLVGGKAADLIYRICVQPARRKPHDPPLWRRRALNLNELVVPAAPEDDPPRQIVAAAARRAGNFLGKIPENAPREEPGSYRLLTVSRWRLQRCIK